MGPYWEGFWDIQSKINFGGECAMPQFASFIEWLVGLSESNQSMVVDYYLSSIQLWFCVNLPFPISHFHLL